MAEKNDSLKNPDGSWKYTNKLVNSQNPHLLQYAHNPVQWHEWNQEALDESKATGKPVFVSVGYSSCYWCHVMEREVFSNAEIAKVINEAFVCIKIDKEERPDLDDILMTARQIMTRDAGWPNNMFLTPYPKIKPFFAGGLFGPDHRYGQISFSEVVAMIKESWETKREAIFKASEEIARAVITNYSAKLENLPSSISTHDIIESLFIQLKSYFDPANGGFFQSPKFPHEVYVNFLVDFYKVTNSPEVYEMVESSLDNIAAGGMHDQVGGGFHRYATDVNWLIPHFEKMLYNQAQLAFVYTKAFSVLKHPHYKKTAEKTLDFVLRKMTGKEGVFYSTIDAETNATEGEYYLWDKEEISQTLSEEEAKLLFDYYSIAALPVQSVHPQAKGGVLHAKSLATIYDAENSEKIYSIFDKLLKKRQKRNQPLVDEKIITSWNGLMIDAFAFAGQVLDRKDYIKTAEKAASYLIKNQIDKNGNLYRIIKDNKRSEVKAFMEDYSFFIKGLLSLYKATDDKKWLSHAITLSNKADELFWDVEKGCYFFTDGMEDLIIRMKTGSDAAYPSDNAIMMHNLIDLKNFDKRPLWENKIKKLLHNFYKDLVVTPMNHSCLIHGILLDSDYKSSDYNNIGSAINLIANDNRNISATHVSAKITRLKRKVKPGVEFDINLVIDINKGWHINSNPASSDFLIPTQAIFKGEGIAVKKVVYPDTKKALAFDDNIIKVYDKKLTITATLELDDELKSRENAVLEVILTVQACDTGTCLSPSNIILRENIPIN